MARVLSVQGVSLMATWFILLISYSGFYFNPVLFTLVLAADQIAVLKMAYSQGVRTDIVQSHLQPVTAVQYSSCFNQVLTACEGGVRKGVAVPSNKLIVPFMYCIRIRLPCIVSALCFHVHGSLDVVAKVGRGVTLITPTFLVF